MERKEKTRLAKEVLKCLATQGVTVSEAKEILIISKEIAETAKLTADAINNFKDWFDGQERPMENYLPLSRSHMEE